MLATKTACYIEITVVIILYCCGLQPQSMMDRFRCWSGFWDNSGPAYKSFILKVGLSVTLKFKTLDRNLASYLSFCPLLMFPLSVHDLVAVTFGSSGISGSLWG